MNELSTQFTQLALQGVSIGAIYSMVALGLVLSYKATEVLNFAHGDIVMLNAQARCRIFLSCRGMRHSPLPRSKRIAAQI